MGKKLPTIKEGLAVLSGTSTAVKVEHSHIVRISPYCKRKTAMDFGLCGTEIWALQRTASQYRFLRVVKGDSAKLFPVANEMILNDDLVDS